MIMEKNILAVDPGISGGFAWRDSENQIHSCAMPETEGDVLNLLRSIRAEGIETLFIEDQIGCVGPGMRVAATAMFTFGRGFGFILGAAQALGFRIQAVRPQKWQKHFSLGTKKDAGGTTPWKNKLKGVAQRLFPNADVTLKTADALLLLEYAGAWTHDSAVLADYIKRTDGGNA